MEEKITQSRPVEPVQVAVIGTGDSSKLATGVQAVTPDPHQPNLIVTVVGPAFAIVIRFINVFLAQFSGLVLAGMAGPGAKLLYTGDFLQFLGTCASLSLPGAIVDLVKNLVTIFGRLERKYPILTGSV